LEADGADDGLAAPPPPFPPSSPSAGVWDPDLSYEDSEVAYKLFIQNITSQMVHTKYYITNGSYKQKF
jgi:hypothetical protein